MKDQVFAQIWEKVIAWCTSTTGVITILTVLAACFTILLIVVESLTYKSSTPYRITRVIVIAAFFIVALHLCQALIMRLLAIKWLTTSIVGIICCFMLYRAFIELRKQSTLWIAGAYIILTAGVEAIFHNEDATVMVGIFGFLGAAVAIIIIICTLADQNESEDDI